MFPRGKNHLFVDLTCPDIETCDLEPCLFSHNPPSRPTPDPTSVRSSVTATTSILKKRPATADDQDPSSTSSKSVRVPNVQTGPKAGSALANLLATPLNGRTDPSQSNSTAAKGAKASDNCDGGPPRLKVGGSSHTAFPIRQKMLAALYAQFLENYKNFPPAQARNLASEHALAQEATLYSKSGKETYRNSIISALARLKKRPLPRTATEAGTLEQDLKRLSDLAEREKGRLTRERVKKFLADTSKLELFDYVIRVPDTAGGTRPTEEGHVIKCDRCGVDFLCHANLTETDFRACSFHWGKLITEKLGGIKQRVWSCCPTPGAVACTQAAHTFRDKTTADLHARSPFVTTKSFQPTEASISPLEIIALDCELVCTTAGYSLARLTVVDEEGKIILDEHIRPQGTILDLNTRFSGVQKGDIEKAKLDLGGVRKALGVLGVNEETILVGHGLENDLKALRWVHLNVIDTAIIFPHKNGGTWRHALRNLTQEYLGQFIQDSGSTVGHSAAVDAIAALNLVRYKVKQANTSSR